MEDFELIDDFDDFDDIKSLYDYDEEKSVIFNTETDEDICMYFNEEGRDLILKALNLSIE